MYEFEYDLLVKEKNNTLSRRGSINFKNFPKDYKEYSRRLGLVIACVREYMGIEQNSLAKKTGVNLFEVELGLRDINGEKIFTLGEELNVHPVMLIAFACCGDDGWSEDEMRKAVAQFKEENKNERRKKRMEMKNKKRIF